MRPGILLMAYGAAARLEDVPEYLRDIRGGRPADAEFVAQVRDRYHRMGGCSPLLEITRRQAELLEERVKAWEPRAEIYVGMRHSSPTILDAVRLMMARERDVVVSMPLTPYFSKMSVGAYHAKYEEAVRTAGARFATSAVRSWNKHPLFIEAWARKIREARGRFSKGGDLDARVLFTAHSLPQKIVVEGDPYPEELSETVRAVAAAAQVAHWDFAYQSRGRTEEPWLGPDAGEVIERLASEGCRRLLLVPIGFISDHMETLYDDDVLYRGLAESKGIEFVRAGTLNADPLLAETMADVALAHLVPQPQ